ncbi:glycoside hydrolase family 2 protein [Photobacterium sp. SDRW27]|uniref:beta-mannosidase n=1 Tax=Photobacterium obscurum TaxID=2829490 RepID=UPI002244EDD6|nr:glycoside hydrolase family 2 protein [Photobacterium obscurum]MCW8329219.1 glycoside hydrolase family 2 protein [Photobacterium obscurum]
MSTLLLDGEWQLSSPQHPHISIPCQLPGDIHSALLRAEKLPHPYLGCNETEVQWVGESDWRLTRTLYLDNDTLSAQAVDLCLGFVDTMAAIRINGKNVLQCTNMFRQYRQDIRPFLKSGENQIEIELFRNDQEAAKQAERLPFPVPWAVGNNQIPHMNTLRKTQCHAGWDWGICLLVSGIYQSISLIPVHQTRLQHVRTTQQWHDNGSCDLTITTHYEVLTPRQAQTLQVEFDQQSHEIHLPADSIGKHQHQYQIHIAQPKHWWPAGYGRQHLYPLKVKLNNHTIAKKIGLRKLELETLNDDIGTSMTFKVNDVAIMAKGANWIPLDALPAEHTDKRYRQLLEDAVAANMNMIRVWGGGMYEHDIFYELCDELGLLVWQDLMFACALYPSTPEFLQDVEAEVRDQIHRLGDHPSLALWCGDNEVIGAIGWYPESKNNREKYVVNYDRLNRTLATVVEQEDPTRRFWASSPCNGELDFGDAWHDDNSGDMHFWDVWHSGKSFDAYHSVKPRFCSEFGFQSWPSLPTVTTYAERDDWNVTSPTFEQHQKNSRGNSIITEMFTRYFRFPNSFENMLYLSQVQQALAIKTASEYWRAHKAHCRGILYWQLNDCWPVSSWSSIEYTGRWKQLHYHTKRFFAPQLATFIKDEQALTLHLISDSQHDIQLEGRVLQISWEGEVINQWPINVTIEADQAMPAWQLASTEYDNEAKISFFHVILHTDEQVIENSYYPALFKHADLQKANIQWQIESDEQGLLVSLDCDAPALFVHLEYEGSGRFDDSSFTLLPSSLSGGTKLVRYTGPASKQELAQGLTVYHLRDTY